MFGMIPATLLNIDRGLFWVCAVFLVVGMILDARGHWPAWLERPEKELSDGGVVLRISWLGLSWFGTLITMLPTSLLSYLRGNSSWLTTAPICLFVAGILLFTTPGTICVSSDGLEEQFWFWKNKRIRWGEIVEIETDNRGRSLTIKAADGTKIMHSSLLSGRQRLLIEIEFHCRADLPANFPNEPLQSA